MKLDRVCPYNPLQAQMDYESKRENCGCKCTVYLDDINHILVHLKKDWSPEMIVGRYEKEHGKPFPVSVTSIYRYATAGLFQLSQKLLIRLGKKLKNNEKETRGKMPQLKKSMHVKRLEAKLGTGKRIQSLAKTIKVKTLH